MGYSLSILSFFGIVALAGVVVNDSLVMIDYINRARASGESLHDAVMAAGAQRFRPILLTTLTTFFGLLPMIMEKSVQAQFLIPMAISLGFGVVVATTITLILVAAVDELQRTAEFSQEEGFSQRIVASSDNSDILILEERTITGGTHSKARVKLAWLLIGSADFQ